MARHVLIVLVIALALLVGGCLRVQFDRCDDDEPHPDCALLDGGADAEVDGATNGAENDAGT